MTDYHNQNLLQLSFRNASFSINVITKENILNGMKNKSQSKIRNLQACYHFLQSEHVLIESRSLSKRFQIRFMLSCFHEKIVCDMQK